MSNPSLVVFGPQTVWPNDQTFDRLRAVLLNEPSLASFTAAIKDLPAAWPKICQAHPPFTSVAGQHALSALARWIESGEQPDSTFKASNVLITPLTVIVHLVQYVHFLGESGSSNRHEEILQNAQRAGVQGLCTGLLSAIAVACSEKKESLGGFGANALRLAVCIGAAVDLQAYHTGDSDGASSLFVNCPSTKHNNDLDDVLNKYPEAYISVVHDASTFTVTSSRDTAESIAGHLKSCGLTVVPIALQGRFHYPLHMAAVADVGNLCRADPSFQLPKANALRAPVRSNSNGDIIRQGDLHHVALKSILLDQCNWSSTIKQATTSLSESPSSSLVVFGLVECIPRSLTENGDVDIVTKAELGTGSSKRSTHSLSSSTSGHSYADGAIAVVGMSCRFPGADSVEEFWDLISAGTSMLKEFPSTRFPTKGLRRTPDEKFRFLGNFLDDPEAFDHKFFKKSSREAAAMDPQQRLVLQVAYETLESSGYFSSRKYELDRNIGCYLGVGSVDYQDNIGSHLPGAFAALGTLRAFISGRISHFFGWTGPSITMDTACSSSAVAMHSACKALQAGECSAALTGGVNVITSPGLWQNLAGASFLSPTGASKAFDARADGYCRGEGSGLVLLKRLNDAVTDGDNILGVIAGSAVNQNENCTPITVPHSPSQNNLYQNVATQAGLEPSDVTYVEAHGTGTAVGDPIECQSIRDVFGGSKRTDLVHFGSVKSNIGHTEAASGAAALVKSLLMIQHGKIPAQANFETLNPRIPPLEPDNMAVARSTTAWESDFKAVCINNYGAAGSNAALLVCEPPRRTIERPQEAMSKLPLFVSAQTESALAAASQRIDDFIAKTYTDESADAVADLTFNLARKQNRDHTNVLATTVSSLKDIKARLAEVASNDSKYVVQVPDSPKPVVLVFGGQSSDFIGLSRNLYESATLFRAHLDRCESICKGLGLGSFSPDIFEKQPIQDVVKLHCMLFSVQYSSAQAWIDSGLEVSTLVGHSFGQLSAMCISGTLSLEDGLKLVHSRASLVKKSWGEESGSMVAIEADSTELDNVIEGTQRRGSSQDSGLEIACYNGPTSYVLAGAEEDVSNAVDIAKEQSISVKRLSVTHAYHSKFVENILPGLKKVAEELTFNDPKIPLETCSEGGSWESFDAQSIIEHSRGPVHFAQAVQRISDRAGSCIWLESGSASAMGLVKRTLGESSSDAFVQFAARETDALGTLADVTNGLWQQGIKTQFWPFHHTQSNAYCHVNLPPYPFEKTKHWLEYKDDPLEGERKVVEEKPIKDDGPATLVTFQGFEDKKENTARFSVDPGCEQFQQAVRGHAVLDSNLCPASLYCEMAARAASIVAVQDEFSPDLVAGVEELDIHAPLGIDRSRSVTLDLTKHEQSKTCNSWKFVLSSSAENNKNRAEHASGIISLTTPGDDRVAQEFARFNRLLRHRDVGKISSDPRSAGMQGSVVYKSFAKVVNYADYYRGVQNVSALGDQSTGQVCLPDSSRPMFGETKMEPLAIDNFLQVAGLHVNSLREIGDNDVFVCTKMQQLQCGPAFQQDTSWTVYSSFESENDKELVNDIYIFDSKSNELVMTMLGVQFTKVQISSLAKALSRVNPVASAAPTATNPASTIEASPKRTPSPKTSQPEKSSAKPEARKRQTQATKPKSASQNSEKRLKDLLSEMLDVPAAGITSDSTLEDLGVDSLMITELATEISKAFEVALDADTLNELNSFGAIVSQFASDDDDDSIQDDSNDSGETVNTPDSMSSVSAATSVTSESDYGDESEAVDKFGKLAELLAEHLDFDGQFEPGTVLGDAGLDSLIIIEVRNDIEKMFGASLDPQQITVDLTFKDLCEMTFGARTQSTQPGPRQSPVQNTTSSRSASEDTSKSAATAPSAGNTSPPKGQNTDTSETDDLSFAPDAFARMRNQYEPCIAKTNYKDFQAKVYPKQSELVATYIVEGFKKLGCDLGSLQPGQELPDVKHLPKHDKVMNQYYKALAEVGLVELGDKITRTSKPVPKEKSSTLLKNILEAFPQHRSEHKLLDVTGSKLAECLTGDADPIHLLFKDKVAKELLTDVYTNAPMFLSGTIFLANFLVEVFNKYDANGGTVRICELGAGTGGTARYILEQLKALGVPFEYTFTDLSPSLVTAAKKNFADFGDSMKYKVINIEKEPTKEDRNNYDIVISTNCIHATSNLENSTTNINKLLRENGFLCLVELTRELYWFELVFGLVEGWWLFNDGRNHALAHESFWEKSLTAAGFKHVDWTDGDWKECEQLRVITAFKSASPSAQPSTPVKSSNNKETVQYHQVGQTRLYADVHYPNQQDAVGVKRPIAVLIHGGGHIMLSRADIRPPQTKVLLDNEFLPVSIDYRLCPEVSLLDGPMSDACTALDWARNSLPSLKLSRSDIKPDGSRVVAVGWSTGGHLAMTLAYTAIQRSITPPDAILAFYCPTDYEDSFWQKPNVPDGSEDAAAASNYDLLEGVASEPLTAYNVDPKKHALGGWMETSDARSRIALHMNWRGQALPVLFGGLAEAKQKVNEGADPKQFHALPQPPPSDIRRVSPRAHIDAGDYKTPTFIVHGTRDDLIPWEQAQGTYDALVRQGVPAGFACIDGAIHLFDLHASGRKGKCGEAIRDGYKFLAEQLNLPFVSAGSNQK